MHSISHLSELQKALKLKERYSLFVCAVGCYCVDTWLKCIRIVILDDYEAGIHEARWKTE